MLPSTTVIGRLMRLPLRLVPRTAVVPVVRGPLRGARWLVGAADHGFWLGHFERDVQDAMARILRPGDVVYDVGANVGFFTLLASRLVGRSGKVYAFEPFPENVRLLRNHLAMNGANNVEVLEVAVADRAGVSSLVGGGCTAHLGEGEGSDVQLATLDDLCLRGGILRPSVVKMDIEGAEFRALSGGREVLRRARPRILVELHGKTEHDGTDTDQASLALLRDLGYRVERLPSGKVYASPADR